MPLPQSSTLLNGKLINDLPFGNTGSLRLGNGSKHFFRNHTMTFLVVVGIQPEGKKRQGIFLRLEGGMKIDNGKS
jgi:hypothetical protein